MLNRKYFPFERNNYYYGKLLTAKDFEAEQRYGNDKRRLLNRLTGANGVLSGLGVIMADDTSIIVQAGCALDAAGREIVVPETRVIKLSTIDGYDQLTSNCAYVGIAYEEQPAEQMYAAMGDTQDQTVYNKVQEKYRLNLLDEEQVASVPSSLEEYVFSRVLYQDENISLTQYLPRYVTRGNGIAVRVVLERRGHGQGEYSFGYTLDAPGFDAADGTPNTLKISASGIQLRGGGSRVFTYFLFPQDYLWGVGESVTLSVRGLSVRAGDEDLPAGEPESCQLRPVEGSFAEQYLKDFYGKAMDKQLAEIYDERLWLAKLNLIRQGNAIIIDSVEPSPFHQYVYNAQQLMTLRELEEFYPQQNRVPVPSRAMGEQLLPGEPRIPEENRQGRMACGVFDLGLGLDYSTREAVFSDEIMHGLGKGAVYVDVGVEYIRAADGSHEESSAVYLGDMSIFEQESSQKEEDRVYKISTAVKVLPDRGTFVVGVRLGDVSGLISLRIRWYAWRMGETSKQVRSDEGGQRYMLVKPDMVVVPPKGTAHITPVFVNMPTEPCRYSLVDARGGSIDNNGVYTAPAAEGVYEIRIEAISDPTVFTHAFAVVTQKKKES